MKKKISEAEENKMYSIISDALFSLCELKPIAPIKYLAKIMLEIIDEKKVLEPKKKRTTISSETTFYVTAKKLSAFTSDTINKLFEPFEKLCNGNYGPIFKTRLRSDPSKQII